MNEAITRRGAVKLALLSVVLMLAIAVPVSVWASHHFNDVPNNHPFHSEISAIADAGITKGYTDGGYHPRDPITRQAMAAFLERGLGRVGINSTGPSGVQLAPSFGMTNLTHVMIETGATGAGSNGFVHLVGTAQFTSTAPSACPCRIDFVIVDESGFYVGSSAFDMSGAANPDGQAVASATVQGVVPVQGDSTRRFVLRAILYSSTQAITARGTLSAVYLPFGPDGDDTLAFCQDGEPNGSIGQAQPLVQPMYGCIDPVGDHDFFSLTLASSGQRLTAETTGFAGAGTCDMDTFVWIRDSAGVIVAQDDDAGTGLCSIAATGSLAAGTYYIEVAGFNDAYAGTYRLTTSTGASASSRDAIDKD